MPSKVFINEFALYGLSPKLFSTCIQPLQVRIANAIGVCNEFKKIFHLKLYCIVLYCIVLYCIVLYCIVLYCIVLYCIVLYCIVLYCIVLFHYCMFYWNIKIAGYANGYSQFARFKSSINNFMHTDIVFKWSLRCHFGEEVKSEGQNSITVIIS